MYDSITFVIASFNAGDTIEKTLASIVSNCDKQDQIIVIDGNSEDSTVDRANFALKDCTNYLIVSEPDDGIYDAWNKGIELSTGSWLAFVGCGDILRDNYRTSMSAAIAVDSGCNFIHFVAKYYVRSKDNDSNLGYLGRPLEKHIFKHRMRVCHVGALHRKDLFNAGFFSTNFRCVSDYEFLLKNLHLLETFFIQKVLVDMEATGVSSRSLAVFTEEFAMKKRLGGYNPLVTLFWMIPRSIKRLIFIARCRLEHDRA